MPSKLEMTSTPKKLLKGLRSFREKLCEIASINLLFKRAKDNSQLQINLPHIDNISIDDHSEISDFELRKPKLLRNVFNYVYHA